MRCARRWPDAARDVRKLRARRRVRARPPSIALRSRVPYSLEWTALYDERGDLRVKALRSEAHDIVSGQAGLTLGERDFGSRFIFAQTVRAQRDACDLGGFDRGEQPLVNLDRLGVPQSRSRIGFDCGEPRIADQDQCIGGATRHQCQGYRRIGGMVESTLTLDDDEIGAMMGCVEHELLGCAGRKINYDAVDG